MLAIWEATLLLLLAADLANCQVAPITGNNNADFATGSFYIDTSLVYGNASALHDGPNITITFPSDFVSPSTPSIINSILKWENFADTSKAQIDFELHLPGITSTSAIFSYFSNSPYFIKTAGYYYLVISSKYNSSPYFTIVNCNIAYPNQNVSSGTYINLTTPFSSTFNSTGAYGIVSINAMAITLYSSESYNFGLVVRYSSNSGGQATLTMQGTSPSKGYVYGLTYDLLLFNTAFTYASFTFNWQIFNLKSTGSPVSQTTCNTRQLLLPIFGISYNSALSLSFQMDKQSGYCNFPINDPYSSNGNLLWITYLQIDSVYCPNNNAFYRLSDK